MLTSRNPANLSRLLLLSLCLFAATTAYAQRERQIQPVPADDAPYGRRFFTQLRTVFGRFRDADLQRAFDNARPIQCSQLVNDDGEWRTVAFINEKRELGDWYRRSLEEVKSDLAVFIFSGMCRGDRGPVQLTTKFPVTETIEAYSLGRIGLDDVEVNVNAPVRAFFDPGTQGYSFDLPYLFLVDQQDSESVYSLEPPRLAERDQYATDVIEHWDCKSVAADEVTYQFLICRTTTAPRIAAQRNQARTATFGASAYFILSDGREASANVKLTFNDVGDKEQTVEDASTAGTAAADSALDDPGPAGWETPDSNERILSLLRDEFRIRFDVAAWTDKIGVAEVLSGGRLVSLKSSNPAAAAEYCVWLPGAADVVTRLLANDSGEPVAYSVRVHEGDGKSSTSIGFDMRTISGVQMGSLECFFPRAASAGSVAFSRWTSIVGTQLILEVRP